VWRLLHEWARSEHCIHLILPCIQRPSNDQDMAETACDNSRKTSAGAHTVVYKNQNGHINHLHISLKGTVCRSGSKHCPNVNMCLSSSYILAGNQLFRFPPCVPKKAFAAKVIEVDGKWSVDDGGRAVDVYPHRKSSRGGI
jgi:hypothetical protein